MFVKLKVNGENARNIFSNYPELRKFMEWANARSIALKNMVVRNRKEYGREIEEIIINSIDGIITKTWKESMSIKFLDSHGNDILSPDLIILGGGIVRIHAFAITGSMKYTYDELIVMSHGLFVNDPTVINLDKASEFGIVPTIIYYDSTGEIRLSSGRGKYEKFTIGDRRKRLYAPENFVKCTVIDEVRQAIDNMIRDAHLVKAIGYAHHPNGINVRLQCNCGKQWWQDASLYLTLNSFRVECRKCSSRGIIGWQDIKRTPVIHSWGG
jgi:hypothetical protein